MFNEPDGDCIIMSVGPASGVDVHTTVHGRPAVRLAPCVSVPDPAASVYPQVLTRMQQYTGDLLCACLRLVLALPCPLLLTLPVPVVTFAVRTALRVGHSYLPLAAAALDALERWAAGVHPTKMAAYYADVLPLLDGYLKSSSTTGTLDGPR